MLKETELRKDDLTEPISTIYFGGGTPSLLQIDELNFLVDKLHKNYTIAKDVEFTVECNPDDLTKQKLIDLKCVGVNRLSIGVQSFFDDDLQFFNRAHAAKEAEQSILMSQDAGFENITIDLIYGTPMLTQKKWEYNLKKVAKLNVPHLSAYSLTIEPKTALNHRVKTKKIQLLPEEEVIKQFNTLIDFTNQIGMVHYEISNFAKEGYISKHNSNYWKGVNYLGFGPSAHSYLCCSPLERGERGVSKRVWNVSNNTKYIKAVENNEPFFDEEVIDERTAYNEYVMTRLRTIWGIDLIELEGKFNATLINHFKKEITPFIQNECVQQKDKVFTLTKNGIFIADKISSDLFYIS